MGTSHHPIEYTTHGALVTPSNTTHEAAVAWFRVVTIFSFMYDSHVVVVYLLHMLHRHVPCYITRSTCYTGTTLVMLQARRVTLARVLLCYARSTCRTDRYRVLTRKVFSSQKLSESRLCSEQPSALVSQPRRCNADLAKSLSTSL